MRILLVNSNRYVYPWPVIPHGLLRVAAALEDQGHAVEVLDLCFSHRPADDIARCLAQFEPEVVGVSIRNLDTGTGYKVEFLLEDVKREIVDVLARRFAGPIVLGGGAVSINPREILEYMGVDLAVVGDGEEAMARIAGRLEAGEELEGIAGLVKRGDGRAERSDGAARVCNLDRLPLPDPARHLDLERYLAHGSPLQVQTKRGCALNCVYCTYNRIEGKSYRLREPVKVVDEIEHLTRSTGSNRVEFVDSTFNLPLSHCKDVLREVIRRGLKLKLSAMGVSPAAVDEELLRLMRESGFTDISLGVESLDDHVLTGLGKDFTSGQVRAAGELARRMDMPVMWFILLGGPGETGVSALSTLEKTTDLAAPWDLVVIGVGLRAYRDAPIAEMVRAADPSCSSDRFLRPVSYSPEGWDLAQFSALAKRACLNNPNFLVYGQDLNYPAWVGRVLTALAGRLSPNRPVWRAFIAVRRIERWLGISALRRVLFRRAYPNTLARLSEAMGKRL